MSYIKGNFKKYIFKSDNLYAVGLFRIKETSPEYIEYKNQIITFTGYFTDLNESDLYKLNGSFLEHNRYGLQFQTESYEVILPEEKDKIIEFLSSALFPNIGEKKATKIVDTLGEDALNIIISDHDVLLNVKGLTEKQRQTIISSLEKYRYSYEIVVELTKLGFNPKDALLIYNYYKDDCMNVVNNNPYIIINDINEITFKKVDRLRGNFKIEDDNISRLEAAVKYIMEEVNFSYGSTYLNLNEIVAYTKKALYLNNEGSIYNAINNLVLDSEIVKENEMYFLRKMYDAEHFISDRFCFLNNNLFDKKIKTSDIKTLEDHFMITYNEEQKKAIKMALENNILVITGGPGTGKTTIIKAICRLYQETNGLSNEELTKMLALLAPTGRASKRIAEQTNLPAYTIHRFLKWQKENDSFIINEENKSNVRFVIVDEASMLDTYLLYNLLLGLKETTKIVLIGDYNQLPSVGPGQVLKDVIDSDVIPVMNLKQLYRQEETSKINLLAHAINNSEDSSELFNVSEELEFINATNETLKTELKDIILKYKNTSYDKIQVMAPIYKGENGIDELNNHLQSILNRNTIMNSEIKVENTIFREKDKVLQLVNMPDDNIYNGDIGQIVKINKTAKEMLVSFSDEIIKISPSNYSNLKLGYTISIHKSQGSEFDIVIIPVLNCYGAMLYKKLIYTGITRAKKKLIIIGENSAFQKAINNNREQTRNTNLKNILQSRY